MDDDTRRRVLIGSAALAAIVLAPLPPQKQLKRYEGRYYVINTDLIGDDLREAELRMTRMAEEYKKRTEGFSGTITRKFPFYLFRTIDHAWS